MFNNKLIKLTFASIFFIFIQNISFAEKFLCTKSNNVNFRNGPGFKFAIIYKVFAKGYPLKIIETIENWHAVEDFVGEKMWVSTSNLQSKCGNIVQNGKTVEVKTKPNIEDLTILTLESGFIIENIKCYEKWCFINVNNVSGWIEKESLWVIN